VAAPPDPAPAPAAADGVGIHWLTLRFSDPEVERDFQADRAPGALANGRISFAVGIVLYAAFGALDPHIIPEAVGVAWIVRYAVVIPLAALLIGSSFLPGVARRLEWGNAFVTLLAGAGIVLMAARATGLGRELYYAGLLLVSTFTYTFLRLRFANATLVSWAMAAIYLASIPLAGGPTGAVLVNNLFFLVAFNVMGMSACYSMERSTRRDYLQRRTIAEQAERLAEALGKVKVLSGLLPVCAWCHKVRSDGGYWQKIEAYVTAHSDASFTHGICPDCLERIGAEQD
jgi:hypothetical protein